MEGIMLRIKMKAQDKLKTPFLAQQRWEKSKTFHRRLFLHKLRFIYPAEVQQ